MKWDEFRKQCLETDVVTNREETNIECPKCGRKLFKRTDIVLTTYPAQYQYECNCGWIGYALS